MSVLSIDTVEELLCLYKMIPAGILIQTDFEKNNISCFHRIENWEILDVGNELWGELQH